MKTFPVLLVLHLENRIPITRDDTPWRSIAMTLSWAKQPSIPRGSKRSACQTRPQGRNGYGVWHETIMEGGRNIDRSYKKENR